MPPSGPDQIPRRPDLQGRGQRPARGNRRAPPRDSGAFASVRPSHIRSSVCAEQSPRIQTGRASSSHVKGGLLSSPDQGASDVLQGTPKEGLLDSSKKSSQGNRLRASAPEFVPGRTALLSGMGQPVKRAEAQKTVDVQHSIVSEGVSATGGDDETASGTGVSANEKHTGWNERGASIEESESARRSLKQKEGQSAGLWKGMEESAGSLSKKEALEARTCEGASTSGSGVDIQKLDEPVLSEEERASNEQEQQDEVMVLESIFAADFVETGTAPRTFSLSVHVSLPASHVEILGRLSDAAASGSGSVSPSQEGDSTSSADNDETSDSVEGEDATAPSTSEEAPSGQIRVARSWQGGRMLSLTLEHLPPLRLTCTLPAAYPSHAPPKFTLSSVWLTQSQLGRLCKGLDSIWEETPGQVVVYSWADWLGRETFETLGLGTRFEIAKADQVDVGKGKRKEGSERDERAKAEGWGVQDVLPRLLRYNEEKMMEEFRRGVHECQVCFSEQPGAEFVHLWPGCRHNFCRGCMTALVDIHVREGSLAQLTCPQPDCKESLPPNVIKDLLEPAQFERWETLMLQRTFDSMTDVVYCPRCETPTIEEADHTAQCQKCFFAFCSLCDDATHFGSQCMDAEAQLAILRERTRGRLPAEEQKRKEAALLNEILNMKYVDREARKCPQCGMAIQKDEGCNKMTCSNCNAYFCYKCGKAIDGYDHFNSGTCVLFEAAEIDAWNRMMAGVHGERNEARDLVDARAQLFPNRVRACPACRQPNVKEAGNNHLRCWSCHNHFCGACGKHVLKGSHHFGPKGCKQHTPD